MSSKAWISAASALLFFGTVHAFQRPFREYPGIEYNDFPLPADWQRPAEFMFARLMYPPFRGRGAFGYDSLAAHGWQKGLSIWTQDYPRADRHFLQAATPLDSHRQPLCRTARESGRR